MNFTHTFGDIISVENLLAAWKEFLRGKRKKQDVQAFQLQLMQNILNLHEDLRNKTYHHAPYHHFRISDPKPRDIHKASVRDRLLHHAIYRVLYPFFDTNFVFDSYSCRCKKGTHRAFKRFCEYARDASHNHTRTVWVLKCDIRKFFANINHRILKEILTRHIRDANTLGLLGEVIDSFHTEGRWDVDLPLGNLTSQLLGNIYMNEFDWFVKKELRVRHFVRYADDFVVLHEKKEYLQNLLTKMSEFLEKRLHLSLHPDKVFIKTFASGVDFLGWVHFPDHRVLRTSTKRRMLARVNDTNLSSYLGLCKHGNTYTLRKRQLTKEPLWL